MKDFATEQTVQDRALPPYFAAAAAEDDGLLHQLNDYIRCTEFKRLINQIVMAQSRSGFKSLAVLSEFPREGRTFFTSALALAYARYLPSRVLILDTVNQTRNHTLYFSSILGVHLPESLQSRGLVEPGVVDLISTQQLEDSPDDSSDFQVGRLIASMQERYDLVIVDTCALSYAGKHNIDPIIIGRQVDASVLVTSRASIDREILGRIKRKLTRYGIEPLGSVFNAGLNR